MKFVDVRNVMVVGLIVYNGASDTDRGVHPVQPSSSVVGTHFATPRTLR